MQFGRCYEEFEVGALYKHWPGRTITEYDDALLHAHYEPQSPAY